MFSSLKSQAFYTEEHLLLAYLVQRCRTCVALILDPPVDEEFELFSLWITRCFLLSLV